MSRRNRMEEPTTIRELLHDAWHGHPENELVTLVGSVGRRLLRDRDGDSCLFGNRPDSEHAVRACAVYERK